MYIYIYREREIMHIYIYMYRERERGDVALRLPAQHPAEGALGGHHGLRRQGHTYIYIYIYIYI